MKARQAGRWSTTQENAWAIISLTDWMAASGELAADYSWRTDLNGDELGSGRFSSEDIQDQVELRADITDLLRTEANVLAFSRSEGPGQLYYTTQLRYHIDALAVDARDRGIVVDRRFELDGERVNGARVGDVVSVTVTIIVPQSRYHVLVEVPIPAGTEPIDPSLAITGQEFEEPGPWSSGWRQWRPTYTDMRDDRMALFATYLPAGTYTYTFQARAALPGEYRVLPVYAEQMYFNEVWGRSAGELFSVRE
jgi:uncharacterized protein YfaS (alpha-2-macroglobulin family)